MYKPYMAGENSMLATSDDLCRQDPPVVVIDQEAAQRRGKHLSSFLLGFEKLSSQDFQCLGLVLVLQWKGMGLGFGTRHCTVSRADSLSAQTAAVGRRSRHRLERNQSSSRRALDGKGRV